MNRLAAAAALLGALTGAARAERTLTLEEALALADRKNLNLEAARARLDEAGAAVRQAWAALLPIASAQGRYTHNYKEVELMFPGGGSAVIQKGEQLDASVNVAVPLLAPPAYPGLTAARRSRDAAEAQVRQSRADVLYGVAQTFYTVAGAEELAQARTHAVEVAKKTLEDAQARLKVGSATEVEVSRAEIAVVRAEQAADDSVELRDRVYRALATAIELREPFRVAAGEDAAAPSEVDVNGAVGRRPDVNALERSVEALDAQVSAQGWRWAPVLSAFGNGRVFNYQGFSGDKYAWAVGLQLDWTIFDGGARDAQRLLARAQRHQAEARLRLLRETVADEVTDADKNLATRRRAQTAAARAAELARKTLDLVRVQYENGAATQLDLLQAQDALVAGEVGVAQARFDVSIAELALRRALGVFP